MANTVKGFCITGFQGQVTTSFAFYFDQSFLFKNHYTFFGVTKIWQANKVPK